MTRPEQCITDAYRHLQRALHAQPEGYGGKGKRWAPTVAWLARRLAAVSVLDYGCGAGTLGHALALLGVVCRDYDPAVPGKDGRPSFADLVVCTDVLEHVEPDKLPAVLTHLRELARRGLFAVVSLRPSNKTLADGRNAHLIIEPPAWWSAQLTAAGWTIATPDDLPIPRKVSHEKQWIIVARP
jgi:hypothetical protein